MLMKKKINKGEAKKVYKKLRKFFADVLGIAKHKQPKIILNIGDKWLWSNREILPLVIVGNVQVILMDNLVIVENAFKELKKYKDFLFEESCEVYYVKKDGEKVYIGNVWNFIKLHIIRGITEFYSYADFGDRSIVACVGYSSRKKTWYGWSHRAMAKFKVGDKIKYHPDLLILSHGYIEGCEGYKRESENIEKVKSWFKDGILYVDSDEKAKFLAYRIAEATG